MKKFSFTLSLVLVFLVVFACERELSGTAKKPAEVLCDNEIDDDADGKVDCDDSDCATSSHCTGGDPETICDDDIDNDGDGAVDCKDTDCASAEKCAVPKENCTNEIDDDRDGLVDCDDPDCASHTACNIVGPEEICDDGLDNDLDGPIDCDDADCAEATNCLPSVEVCTDGVDNDLDGFVDCEDVDCANHASCQPVCGDGFIEGNEQCEGSNFNGETCVSRGFDGGSLTCTACIIRTLNCTECGDGICEGAEAEANCPADCDEGPVCGNGLCESGETEANCPADCDPVVTVEDCDNGQDDDGDGFIDCDDADCWSEAACQVVYCGDGTCNGSETQANCPADCGTVPALCGNGVLNSGESCDGANLNGKVCSTLGLGFTGGSLSCTSSCTFNTTACTSSTVENCSNGLDDDRDGLIDWLDPSCSTSYTGERYCSDGVDNDSDGYTDCNDHDCAAADVCRTSQASGDQYLVMFPGNGYIPGGCDGTDGAGWTTTCTGKVIMGNYKTSSNVFAVSYSQADPAVGTDLCSASVMNTVNLSGFQFMCVSPTSGACANAAVYVGCSIDSNTGRQTQANLVIVMNKYDSSQISQRNAYFPNGRWREISISGVVWYRGLTPQ